MEDSLAEPCLRPVSWLIKERRPKLVLTSNSLFGMELAPALAIKTKVPLATDCTDIRIENDDIRVRFLKWCEKEGHKMSCVGLGRADA